MAPHIKTLTIDGYYSEEEAEMLTSTVYDLSYTDHDFGRQIDNFNLLPPDASDLFSKTLNMNIEVHEDSGFFRISKPFIHFESFETSDDWLFVVALQESIFNVYEHNSGAKTALDEYKLPYQNFFQWKLTTTHILQPGQGVLFRPWLFHSFDTGLVQLFKMREVNVKLS